VVARAQQPSMPVIGVLGFTFANKNFTVPFLQGLKETGYVEVQNLAIEQRWAENQPDRLPALRRGGSNRPSHGPSCFVYTHSACDMERRPK
jgi:hypothetical protein